MVRWPSGSLETNTHTDRVIYIRSRASSLFYVPPKLESLLLRARQMIVAVGADEKSLQRRLFKFTGSRPRTSNHRHTKGDTRTLS